MKFLLLSLALLGVALCQDDCDIRDEDWVRYRTGSNVGGSEWEDFEVITWGMDGGNKWYDWWLRPSSISVGMNRYRHAVTGCGFGIDTLGRVPNDAIPPSCGSCSLTAPFCKCYPYTDIAQNYQNWPGYTLPPASDCILQRCVVGSQYDVGVPPFEASEILAPLEEDTAENCRKYRPEYVYFYGRKLRLSFNGEYRQSVGISLGFTPSLDAWEDFCNNVYSSGDDRSKCWLPSPNGGRSSSALFGSDYWYQSGFFRLDDNNEIDVYTDKQFSGCHSKQSDYRFPSGVYCGDDSAWTLGAGTTAHVRFGCDRGTFFDTSVAVEQDIDDADCNSVYVLFDEMNPLENLKANYDSEGLSLGDPDSMLGSSGCWVQGGFTDYTTDMPSYRTPCSANGLAVPLFAVMAAVLMVVLGHF